MCSEGNLSSGSDLLLAGVAGKFACCSQFCLLCRAHRSGHMRESFVVHVCVIKALKSVLSTQEYFNLTMHVVAAIS